MWQRNILSDRSDGALCVPARFRLCGGLYIASNETVGIVLSSCLSAVVVKTDNPLQSSTPRETDRLTEKSQSRRKRDREKRKRRTQREERERETETETERQG